MFCCTTKKKKICHLENIKRKSSFGLAWVFCFFFQNGKVRLQVNILAANRSILEFTGHLFSRLTRKAGQSWKRLRNQEGESEARGVRHGHFRFRLNPGQRRWTLSVSSEGAASKETRHCQHTRRAPRSYSRLFCTPAWPIFVETQQPTTTTVMHIPARFSRWKLTAN